MKTIVYYYTLTGHCETIATLIADQLNCDSEKIIEKKKRLSKGFLRFLNGGSALQKNTGKIEVMNNNPAGFDRIIIVTPFWAASPTPAVRGFAYKYKEELKDKTLGLALTNLGTDPEEAFSKYKELFLGSLINVMYTNAKNECADTKISELIDQFISDLGTVI